MEQSNFSGYPARVPAMRVLVQRRIARRITGRGAVDGTLGGRLHAVGAAKRLHDAAGLEFPRGLDRTSWLETFQAGRDFAG